jgi:superfamily II DNA/RNA helicase
MTTNEKWEKLEAKVQPQVIKAVHDAFGFEYMMPVQKESIPLFLKNYDIAVQVDLFSMIEYILGRNWFG